MGLPIPREVSSCWMTFDDFMEAPHSNDLEAPSHFRCPILKHVPTLMKPSGILDISMYFYVFLCISLYFYVFCSSKTQGFAACQAVGILTSAHFAAFDAPSGLWWAMVGPVAACSKGLSWISNSLALWTGGKETRVVA